MKEKKGRGAEVRCAIYTRKSTEEGLEQEFNPLDAQRESAEAFIKSQAHEGWVCLKTTYDDGGFTGGNMDRPAFQRLMADIEAGKLDCVVDYKVDRLLRSLLDFAGMMEIFDWKQISFASVSHTPFFQCRNLVCPCFGPRCDEFSSWSCCRSRGAKSRSSVREL